jgi:hypothetical protein
MTSHDDIRSLLGVYALDAIDDPDELATVETHLARCSECREEVDGHRSVAAVMAQAELTAPTGLWDRIGSELEPASAPSSSRWSGIQGITSMAAVVSVVAAVGMTVLWTQANRDVDDLRDRIGELQAAVDQAQLELERDPVELAVERAAVSGAALEVTVGGDIGTSRAVVLPDGHGWLTDVEFAPLDSSQTYQLWAIQDGAVISAGVLGSSPGTVSFQIDASRLDGLVITVEEAGGVVSSSNPAAAAWLAET